MHKKFLILVTIVTLLSAGFPIQTFASILDTDGILCLINRGKKISKLYEPVDLVKPDVQTNKKSQEDNVYMRSEAALSLEKLFAAAQFEEGYILIAVSGYRSFGIQQILFSQKAAETGSIERAGRTVAPAGASEHQLGLAMDVVSKTSKELNRNFGSTPEGQWVAENAHRFGYIVRYKAKWSDITGYSAEPWHIRYVGIAHATAIYSLDIPFETYIEQMQILPEYILLQGNSYLLSGLYKLLSTGDESILPKLASFDPGTEDEALRRLSKRFLPAETTYEDALWAAYPTPIPTSAPRIDTDTDEITLYPANGGN